MKQEPELRPDGGSAPEPQIDYPTEWGYTVFGSSEVHVRQAVQEVLGSREHEFAASNRSKTGKYCSFKLRLVVTSEEDRNDLSSRLAGHAEIVFVL